MRSLQSFASSATIALLLSGAVAAPAQATKLKLPEIKYETFTLPNGLKVITHEDHRLPLVAVDLWYHVGPLNERPGRTGFAHLFEHMMFEGSEHHDHGFFQPLLSEESIAPTRGAPIGAPPSRAVM